MQEQLHPERGVRQQCVSSNFADTKASEGGGGGAPGARAEIALQLMVETWSSTGGQKSTHSPWRPIGKPTAHGGPTPEQVDAQRNL